MRMIFSLVGLLIVVAIVGVVAKKQISTLESIPVGNSKTSKPDNIVEQSKQIQTQVKDQLNDAMKAAAEAQTKALESGGQDKSTDKTGSAY